MASKGSYALGTDGTDFKHRQRVVSTHMASADAKYYLKLTFYLHLILYIIIVLKLSEDLLDRADIFILELQELEIPKPDLWEWLYGLSFFGNLLALRAMRTNSARLINLYHIATWLLSLTPLLLAQTAYFPDFVTFLQERDTEKVRYVWRQLPIAVIFQAFALVALQVHLMQVFYAYRLYKIWSAYLLNRSQTQQQQQSTNSANSAQGSNSFGSKKIN